MSAESAPEGEADGSTDAEDKEFSCPSCDRLFGTERGVSVHHVHAHGESIGGAKTVCDYCSEEYQVKKNRVEDSRFCSQECRNKWQSEELTGESNPSFKEKVDVECKFCSKNMELPPSIAKDRTFCSMKCKAKHQSENWTKEDHPNWSGGLATVECKNCGEEYEEKKCRVERTSYCSKECLDEHRRETDIVRGENNHRWKGGYPGYYGANWQRQRKKALDRDDYTCQVCGSKDNLHVHHVHKILDFENPEDANYLLNLVTLCATCHNEWEGIPLRPT